MGTANFLFIWESRILFLAGGLKAEPHSHYNASFLVSTGEPFEIETENGRLKGLRCVLIAPNVYHELLAENSQMIVLQLDPLSAEYLALATALGPEPIIVVDDPGPGFARALGVLREGPSCEKAAGFVKSLLADLADYRSTRTVDPRILRLVALLKEKISDGTSEQVSVMSLAPQVNLSPDRLMHLFKEEMGLPIRRYLLWLRLSRAVVLLRKDGMSLTEAAHAAGFADSAHLSRTFKEMFGIKPSFFFSDDRFIQVHQCEVW